MGDAGIEQAIEGEMDLLRPDVRGDRARLEALLDDEFVEIGASGRRWEREDLIADVLSSPAPDVDVAITDLTARRVGDTIVLVTYTTVGSGRRCTRSSWWRESDGRWRCFFHQGTVVPDDRSIS
jgi:hypothetical protein